jgi:hypothetical protein
VSALILPVPLIEAAAWARGWISDTELWHAPRTPEAAYFSTLPDLTSFRQALPQFADLYRQGVRVVILRTDSAAVMHHVEKWGAVKTFQGASGKWRYFTGPDSVTRYFGRMFQKSAAASLVTTSR